MVTRLRGFVEYSYLSFNRVIESLLNYVTVVFFLQMEVVDREYWKEKKCALKDFEVSENLNLSLFSVKCLC